MARTRREFIKTTAAAGAMFGAVGEPKIGLIVSQKSRPLDKASLALSAKVSISTFFSELRARKRI
jgi:hypothetical protein